MNKIKIELEEDLTPVQKIFLKLLAVYALLCLIFVITFNTVLMLTIIPSESMADTLMEGDTLIATRYDVGKDDIKRYDILIFIPPHDPSTTYIKRVIGLPGETIEIMDGRVFADGRELDNSFIKELPDGDGDGRYIIPKGHYFFLGDNRNDSFDSRFWEDSYVPLENIRAKARMIIFPFSRSGSLSYEE